MQGYVRLTTLDVAWGTLSHTHYVWHTASGPHTTSWVHSLPASNRLIARGAPPRSHLRVPDLESGALISEKNRICEVPTVAICALRERI